MIAVAPNVPRTPWRPRRVDPATQALVNRLGRGLWLGGVDGWLLIAPSPPVTALDSDDVLALRSGEGVLHIAGGKSWLRANSGIDPAVVPDEFPEERRWFFRSALERCPAVIRQALGETEPLMQPVGADGLTWLDWRLEGAEPGLKVGASAAEWLAWIKRLSLVPAESPALPGEDALRFNIPVALGWSRLHRDQFRQLRAGDFVRLGHAYFNVEGAGRIPVGRNLMGLRWHERNGSGVMEFTGWEIAMTDVQEAAAGVAAETDPIAAQGSQEPVAAASGLGSLDDVPLTVRFEIGALNMNLAELRQLAPGMALMLEVPSPPPVTLRVNGMAVGTGELVEIDGRIAVQVGALSVRP